MSYPNRGGRPALVEDFVNTPHERRCTAGCDRVLPREMFTKDRTKKFGYGYECKDCHKWRRKKRYGMKIDAELWQQLQTVDACEACGRTKDLVVDHDHQTGVVRGVLCGWCNRSLGNMGDDPNKLRALARYIEERT